MGLQDVSFDIGSRLPSASEVKHQMEIEEATMYTKLKTGAAVAALLTAVCATPASATYYYGSNYGTGHGTSYGNTGYTTYHNGYSTGTTSTSTQYVRGATGAQGPRGSTGQTGARGPAGQTGARGPAGQTGARGPAGQTGAQGPAGQAGAQGPAGPQGERGPAGNADVEIVNKIVSKSATGNGGVSVEAFCPWDHVAVGGGYAAETGGNVVVSKPTDDGFGWFVKVENGKDESVMATAYVVCLTVSTD